MADDALRLRKVFDYNPETGEFLWREPPAWAVRTKKAIPGTAAGTIDHRSGDRLIRFEGELHRASRLAWLYVNGVWPSSQVNYIEPSLQVPARDRIANLTMAGDRRQLTVEYLRQLMSYDSESGEFRWLVSRKGVQAGARVGSSKGAKGHRYIRIDGADYSEPRLAWLYVHGRWPRSRIAYRDDNPRNVRIANLVEGEFDYGTRQSPEVTEEVRQDWRRRTLRRRDLRKSFGLTVDEYAAMLLAQNGVCACCGKPETSTIKGRIRHLAVDHDHSTGAIRALACARCNAARGLLGDELLPIVKLGRYDLKHATLAQIEEALAEIRTFAAEAEDRAAALKNVIPLPRKEAGST